jgi:PleD family two-component response regulator
LSEAENIANNICNTFATKPIDKNGDSLYLSASFGVSYIHPEMDESSSKKHMLELIDEVDQKLLFAKQMGKNKVIA